MNQEERRLFTAIRCSDEVREVLRHNAAVLEKAGKIRLTRPENFHLTLIYVGGTSREQDVRMALRELAARPFELSFSEAGVFHRQEGLLIWQGVKLNPALQALYHQLNENLCWRGFCGLDMPYKPHITLGRRFRPGKDVSTEEVLRNLEIPPTMPVDSVSLFESKRDKDRLVYEELERLNFSAEF